MKVLRFALAGVAGVLVIAAVLLAVWNEPPPPAPAPAPQPEPVKPAPRRPRPCPGPCPYGTIIPFGAIQLGGPVGPDGATQVQCDLPVSLRAKNVGGVDGAGLCVFTSIMHSARYQNERRLWDFQRDMQQERGGGWPQRVDEMIGRYGKDTPYLQYEGKDPGILLAALASGRMPAVTYCGRDPHYHGQSVAHMVNLVYLDSGTACILDNNYPDDDQLVWMSAQDFLERWTWGGGGWSVVLLSPAPAPVPH